MTEPQANDVKAESTPMIPVRRKYRRAIAGLVTSGLLTLGGVGVWVGYNRIFQSPEAAVAVAVMPVEVGSVEITVTESGVVELGGQQTLKSPREVTVEQVNVQEGDRVREGQALVVLRDREVQDNLRNQQVENAKLDLELTRRKEKVAEVQVRVAAAQERVQESKELFDRGFISETELQEDEAKRDGAVSELRDAQVEQQKAELDVRMGMEKTEGLQQQFGDRIVTAATAGIVLKLNVRSGDGVKTETEMLTLGDPSKEMVKLQLTTLNAAQVRINQLVRVSTIGPDAKIFTGRVISLSPIATAPTNQGGFGNSDSGQAKVEAKVLLDRPSNTLIPGGLVSVEIVTQQRQQVVVVPPEAIQRSEGEPFVWLADEAGKARKQPVTLGLQGLQQIEVTGGLRLGDRLVMAPPTVPLVPGAVLQIQGGANPE